ncbi:MAG TPA: VOC family protein [Vicinamibacterales bacterium]|nr:VOC family protein [Vicinamibacterales bacterium]
MSIDPGAQIDSIHLTIPSLDRSVRFYEERIGLSLQRREDRAAVMGAGGRDLLWLHESASAQRVRGTTGLYHFAILVPSRADLAAALRHLSEMSATFQGFADHLVSEAVYLADPDGNGIEIYRDRPRAEWPRVDGVLQMGTEPLDLKSLLADASAPWNGLAPGTRIGHVHLHVAELDQAERFYRDGLGLDLVLRYGDSAAFLSAGGYHHHVAVNTWAGIGAPRAPAGAIGLDHFVVRVPTAQALRAVGDSLKRAGIAHDSSGDGLRVSDPSGNQLELRAD